MGPTFGAHETAANDTHCVGQKKASLLCHLVGMEKWEHAGAWMRAFGRLGSLGALSQENVEGYR